MTTDTATALAYYAAHGAALFPIPAGAKSPVGIVASFKHDFSSDPAQWTRWSADHPGCNWGVVAFASNWIIVDIDTTGDRDAAWSAWCALCTEWGIPPAMPHVQSARGGWHVYFQVPPGVDASQLRQPDAIKKRINIRCIGFTVAAGSYYDGSAKGEQSGPYVLLSDAPPHPAPAALIAHCTRAAPTVRVVRTGDRDAGDVAALIRWLAERDAFAAYEDWCAIGMALKLEFGDDGLELWQLAHNETVDADTEATKWASFASEPTSDSVTLASFLKRAHDLGWRGQVRASAPSMFGDAVAKIAANAGATLATGAMPLLAGQQAFLELATPLLSAFLAATSDFPYRPAGADYPKLPDAHTGPSNLVDALNRIFCTAEAKPATVGTRAADALAVLCEVHAETAAATFRRLRAMGARFSETTIRLKAAGYRDQVERQFVQLADWIFNIKGEIEHDNSDNVAVFIGRIGCEVRWNAWLERAEIRGGTPPLAWPEWTYLDDTIFAKLRTYASGTKIRFRPGKEFLWESLLALAHTNPVDPARDYLDALQWDGTPRLSIWLSATCHVPADLYHQAVSRNIIGGIVRRIRNPGCKHDTMAVFFGPQGTGKSTLAALLALRPEWFADSILLGDASKELVLSLAGRTVVEIGEMGMRGAANPNHVKAMISRQVDAGRTAYARAVSERQRRNIFIGTTNDDEPLQDPTGNRRFLPVRVDRHIDLPWIQANIDQLFAEAAVLEAAGADFALPREVWAEAAAHQEAARSESDIETRFADWFALTPATSLSWIAAADLAELTSLAGFRSLSARGAVMKQLGFRKELSYVGGKRLQVWVRGEVARLADIPRLGTRYAVGVDVHGRPVVRLQAAEAAPPTMPLPGVGR